MIQIKMFGAISEVLSDAKQSVEEQANEWLRDQVRATAAVQTAPTLTQINQKYYLMIVLTVTTAD
jgi:hypothetical protein